MLLFIKNNNKNIYNLKYEIINKINKYFTYIFFKFI